MFSFMLSIKGALCHFFFKGTLCDFLVGLFYVTNCILELFYVRNCILQIVYTVFWPCYTGQVCGRPSSSVQGSEPSFHRFLLKISPWKNIVENSLDELCDLEEPSTGPTLVGLRIPVGQVSHLSKHCSVWSSAKDIPIASPTFLYFVWRGL